MSALTPCRPEHAVVVPEMRDTQPARPKEWMVLAAFAAVYVIWGSTYLGIRLAIESIPPFLMAGARYFSAGVIMYAAARLQGATSNGFAEWRTALIVGACLLLGGNCGVTLSVKYLV